MTSASTHQPQGNVRPAPAPIVVALVSLCCLVLTGGCTEKAAQNTPAVSASAAANAQPVNQSAAYRQARSLFANHQYAASDRILVSLLSQPQRTAAERAFLQRQRGICQQSLSGSSRASLTEASTVTDAPTPVAATSDSADCGPRALLLVCQEAHLPASLPELRRVAGVTAPRGASLEGLSKAAASVGFVPQAVQMDRDALANLSTPALAWVDGNHYIVVFEVKRSLRGIDYDTVFVRDPNKPEKETILLTDLLSRSGGVLLTLPRQLPRQKKQ